MKKLFFLFGVLTFMALGGCGARHCSEFPESMHQLYLPYSEGQVVPFIGEEGDTVLFKVAEVYQTGSYSIPWNAKEECDCRIQVLLEATKDNVSCYIRIVLQALFAASVDQHDVNSWMPSEENRYYAYVEVGGRDWYSEYWLSASDTVDSRLSRSYLCSPLDTMSFLAFDPHSYNPEHSIDTLVMVKNRGLVSFRVNDFDGQKYKLVGWCENEKGSAFGLRLAHSYSSQFSTLN